MGWALAAIGNKLAASDGRMQQGAGHYTNFDTETLSKFSTAAYSIAGIYAAVTVGLTLRAAWVVCTRHTNGSSDENAADEHADEAKFINSPYTKSDTCENHVGTV